ncbi:MAG: hypothetical protein ABI678_17285 [Kofleriaceae bacterium]
MLEWTRWWPSPRRFGENQLGWNVGLHVVDSNTFGHAEHFSAGDLFGPAALRLRVSYQAWNR